jgi:hypothetical protein
MSDFQFEVNDEVTTHLVQPSKWTVAVAEPDRSGRIRLHRVGHDLSLLIRPEFVTLRRRNR